jgi:Ca2+-transporting ATPase
MAATVLGTQAWYLSTGAAHWQTMVFTVLCLSQLGHALAIRSERASLFTQGILSNIYLFIAVLLTFLLQMGTIYLPPLNAVFRTAPLSAVELTAALGISAVPFLAVEGEKWLMRRR